MIIKPLSLTHAIFLLLMTLTFICNANDAWQREDRLASKIKQIKSVEDLVEEINGCAPKAYWSKARIAFTWISTNIKYDWAKFRNRGGSYTADETLLKRRGVCSDYASLFETVVESLGYDAKVITGCAKGYGYVAGDKVYINHAWNAVKGPEGEWHLFDVTWGNFYYDIAPEIMIYDHLPGQSAWQLLENPIAKRQFEEMRLLPRNFIEAGIRIDVLKKNCPDGTCDPATIYRVPKQFSFVANEIPIEKKLRIGHKYTIEIEASRTTKFWIKNGFKTKSFAFKNGKHVVAFIPIIPGSSAQLMVGTERRRWTIMQWRL